MKEKTSLLFILAWCRSKSETSANNVCHCTDTRVALEIFLRLSGEPSGVGESLQQVSSGYAAGKLTFRLYRVYQ